MADFSKIFPAIDSAIAALNELKAALEEESLRAAVPAEPNNVTAPGAEGFSETPASEAAMGFAQSPAPNPMAQAQPFATQPAAAPSFAAPAPPYQQAPPASEMICTNCGAAMTLGSKFCTKCGTPVQAPAPIRRGGFCTNCGAALTPVDKFCTKCGTRV
jgi:ribosomal protein L40E